MSAIPLSYRCVIILLIFINSCKTITNIPKNLDGKYITLSDKHRDYYALSSGNTLLMNKKVAHDVEEIRVLKTHLGRVNCNIPEKIRLTQTINRIQIDCERNTQPLELIIEKDTLLPWIKTHDIEHQCEPGSRRAFYDLNLINNQWGKWKLKRGNLNLCMYFTEKNHQPLFAWEWDSPSDARGVIGYPELQLIQSTQHSNAKFANPNRPSLPLLIKDLKELEVTYDTEIFSDKGKYNIAFDLWITEISDTVQNKIRYEFMIWEDYQDFSSFGKKINDIETPFGTYTLKSGLLDKTDEVGQVWNYVAFVRKDRRTAGKVDIKYLIDILIDRKMLPENLYINSIEFGTEFGNSTGYFLVRDYKVLLNPPNPQGRL